MSRQWRNLVFAGGGMKGIAYGGALEELENQGILDDITRVAGTSSGAVVALGVSLGYTSSEISDILYSTEFEDMLDTSWISAFGLLRLLRKFGWNSGKKFESWIGDLIKKKFGNRDATFWDLRKSNKYKDLYVVGTNLETGDIEVFSWETHPEMSVAKAVRISMGIPLLLQAVNEKNQNYVDGVVLRNYPVTIFDKVYYLEPSSVVSSNGEVYNKETLGFRLGSREEMSATIENKYGRITNIIKFLTAVVATMFESVNRSHLSDKDWHRTIYIDSLGVSATDFDLGEEKKDALVEGGRKSVRKYLKWFDQEDNAHNKVTDDV